MPERCLICGAIIPEGRQICLNCELSKPKDLVLALKNHLHETPEERIALQAEEIKQLWQENEQLRARVAQYREALIIANPRIPDTDYHNPADVELLRKARKALHKGISELKVHCKPFDQTPEEDACIEMHEAVVEIDRAIGGEECGECFREALDRPVCISNPGGGERA